MNRLRSRWLAGSIACALLAQTVLPPAALAHDFGVAGGSSPGAPGDPSGGQGPCQNSSDQDCHVGHALDPVDIHRGDYLLRRQDVFLPGRGLSVDITFTYRSRSAYNGPFGYGWDMRYNKRLRKLSDGNVVLLRGDTRKDEFAFTGTSYTAPPGVYDTLIQNANGTWTLTSTHGDKETYDINGNLAALEDRNANTLTFAYDPAGLLPITGQSAYFVNQTTGVIAREYRLTQITDTIGRTISFTYNAEGRLDTVTYEGRTIQYGYDPSGSSDLLTVTMPLTPDVPAGATTTYAYDAAHNLTTVTDPKNQTYLTNVYDSFDCLRTQTYGAGTSTIAYTASAVCPTADGYGTSGYTLKLSPLVVTPLTNLTVSWNVPSASIYDRIELYQQGGSYSWGIIPVNGSTVGSGTLYLSFYAPPGLYEMRYFSGSGSTTPVATSNVVNFGSNPPAASIDVTDRKGFLTRYAFDTDGHITQMEQFTDGNPPGEPASYLTQYEYDADGNRTRILFPRGNSIEMTYDTNGNLTEIRRKKIGAAQGVPDPTDLVTNLTYEASFNFLKTLTDPRGNVTTYTYDYELGEPSKGNLRTITFSTVSGITPQTVFTYNSFGQVDTVTDPNTNVTKYAYDTLTSYLTQLTQGFGTPEAAITQLGYDSVGNITSLTNANNATTTFQYNALNQLEKITAPAPFAFETRYRYDANGNLAQVDRQAVASNPGAQPALGTVSAVDDWQSTVYAYTTLDQLQSFTDDLNHTTNFTYDPNGNRDSITDAKNQTTIYAYDERDLLQTTTDAATPAGVTTSLYDPNGNLASLTDANANPTTYTYDDFDRLTKTTYADSSFEQYGYDAASNLTSRVTPATQTILYAYDALNRLDLKTLPGGVTHDYVYDAGSRLTSVLDSAASASLIFTYDALNRVLSTTNYELRTLNYTYDGVGNRKRLTYPDGTQLLYTYDALNRLTKLTEQGGGSFVAKFAYDALSRRTSLTRFNSVRSLYTYDATNRLLELEHQLLPIKFVWHDPSTWLYAFASVFFGLRTSDFGLGGEAAYAAPPTPTPSAQPLVLPAKRLAHFAYTYDALGNRLTTVVSSPQSVVGSWTYTYDALSQLDTASDFGLPTSDYDYDPVGNRTQVIEGATTTSYTPNTLNQYSQVGATNYTYDPNGNLTSDGTTTYTYDAENRLVSASVFGLPTTVYTYDAFGRRISKVVNGVTTKFTWDGDQLIEELAGSSSQLAEYIYGPGIDEPLRMQRGSVKTYYLADGLGSITHLTDRNGAIVEQYTYDAYGKPTILDATGTVIPQSAFGNRFLFTGREYDQETGLYFNRARYWSPGLGRFLSRDPYTWGPNDPRLLNLSPHNRTDLLLMGPSHPGTLAESYLLGSLLSVLQANQSASFLTGEVPRHLTAGTSSVLEAAILRAGRRHPALLHPYLYALNNPTNLLDPYGYQVVGLEEVFGASLVVIGWLLIPTTGVTVLVVVLIVGGVAIVVFHPVSSTIEHGLIEAGKNAIETHQKKFEEVLEGAAGTQCPVN